ncbi:MAG TPA: DUF4124 domain-containing protein [Casimicrobiaceae bacterium]|nr:DUF4124 domain-containing protein [Casimicrobiaceae bacterium]
MTSVDHTSPARRCSQALLLVLRGVCVLLAVLSGLPSIAQGQVYKCQDAAGKTTYSDSPCAQRGTTLNVPNEAKGNATDGSVCAQLLDERRRLAAEAAQNAKSGRAESASAAKRRQSLAQQYARRCIGITRSGD